MAVDDEHHTPEKGKRPSKWAVSAIDLLVQIIYFHKNLAMYAEPLELNGAGDVLPQDFATAWVAVAPVPRGKRCILVAYKAWAQGRRLFLT